MATSNTSPMTESPRVSVESSQELSRSLTRLSSGSKFIKSGDAQGSLPSEGLKQGIFHSRMSAALDRIARISMTLDNIRSAIRSMADMPEISGGPEVQMNLSWDQLRIRGQKATPPGGPRKSLLDLTGNVMLDQAEVAPQSALHL